MPIIIYEKDLPRYTKKVRLLLLCITAHTGRHCRWEFGQGWNNYHQNQSPFLGIFEVCQVWREKILDKNQFGRFIYQVGGILDLEFYDEVFAMGHRGVVADKEFISDLFGRITLGDQP